MFDYIHLDDVATMLVCDCADLVKKILNKEIKDYYNSLDGSYYIAKDEIYKLIKKRAYNN